MMSWVRPHRKVMLGVLDRQVVKRQSILVYGGGRSTRGWDPNSVNWENAREQGRQGVGEPSSTGLDTRG